MNSLVFLLEIFANVLHPCGFPRQIDKVTFLSIMIYSILFILHFSLSNEFYIYIEKDVISDFLCYEGICAKHLYLERVNYFM